jgi:hypothetical protein
MRAQTGGAEDPRRRAPPSPPRSEGHTRLGTLERDPAFAAFLHDWHNFVWCRDLTLPLCRWCRKPLEGRRTAYCSEQCATLFQENHQWNMAVWACQRRYDGYCADCQANGKQSRFKWVPEQGPNDPRPPHERVWAQNPNYSPMEVHHIIPLLGLIPRSWSCYNHQSNLVLLCRRCHNARHRLLGNNGTRDWAPP